MRMAAEYMQKTKKNKGDFQPVVALDIGGVCISLHPGKVAEALGVELNAKYMPADFMNSCNLLEQSKISHDEWLEQFHQVTGRRFSRGKLMEIWNLSIGPALPGMTEAVKDLVSRGVRFVYLSNTSREHMDCFFSSNEFSHLVTGGVFSYAEGIMKPEQGIYESFEKRYGIPMAYFDDRQENIDAALKRHWHAVLFHSPEQFYNEVLSLLQNAEKDECR